MGRTPLAVALLALGLCARLAVPSAADRYLNQTKEERPRKKKKVKGFDYENSRYLAPGSDIGGRYKFEEDEAITAGAKPKKKAKKEKAPEEGADAAAAAPTDLGSQQAKPAFKKMKSFGESSKSKKGAGGITADQVMQAGQAAAQQQAQGGQGGQGGQWQNFGTPPSQSGYGNAGNVKVMP